MKLYDSKRLKKNDRWYYDLYQQDASFFFGVAQYHKNFEVKRAWPEVIMIAWPPEDISRNHVWGRSRNIESLFESLAKALHTNLANLNITTYLNPKRYFKCLMLVSIWIKKFKKLFIT